MRHPISKYFTLLLLSATFFSGQIFAAQSASQEIESDLTLIQALQESQMQSLQIQKAKSALEETEWKHSESLSTYLPTVSASVNYLTDKKYMLLDTNIGGNALTIPQVLPTTIYSLRATLPVFDGFASTNRYRSTRSLTEAAKNDYEWTQFNVSRQTVLQFYKSMASYVLQNVAEQNLKTLEDHLKDVHAFKKAGVSTNYDVLRVEVQVSEAQTELLNSQDNVELAKYKLGEVLGKDSELRNLKGQLPVLTEASVAKLDQQILNHRKDILSLQQKSESANHMADAMNRYWIPRLNIFGETQYYNNQTSGFDDSDHFRNAYTVGLNMTWNIFDGLQSTSRSGQSEQQAIQVEKALKISQLKARQDFEFWKRKFKYFTTAAKSRLNDIQRSEEAVRLAKEGRKAGVTTSTQLLDAESDLFRSRAGLVNAQIGSIEALINLELASGQTLYNFN